MSPLHPADSVIMLESYSPADATARAKAIAAQLPGSAATNGPPVPFAPPPQRCPTASGLSGGMKVNAGRTSIRFGELAELDLGGVEQIIEHSQVTAVTAALWNRCLVVT